MPTFEQKPDPRLPKKEAGADPLVAFWRRRLELAEKKLEKAGGDIKSGEWARLLRFCRGDQWPDTDAKSKGRFHRITANQAKSNIDSIRPQLYFQNPKARIRIKNPAIVGGKPVAMVGGRQVDASVQTRLIEAADNYYLGETNAKRKFRQIINDALKLPYGVAKWEWVVEIEEAEESFTEEKTGQQGIRKVEIVARQYPRLTRVKPWQFIWDHRLDEFNLDLASWVAEIRYLTRDEIESDPKLKVDLDQVAAADAYSDDSERDASDKDFPEEARLYKVYDIHDLEGDQMMVWVQGTDRLARHEKPNPYSAVEGGIYTVLGFDDEPDSSIPTPIPSQIMSMSQAYNFMLSYQTNHAARFNRKYYLQKGMMTPEEEEKLERGADGTIVKGEGPNGEPRPIQDAPMSVDIYNVAATLKREITEAIGVTAYDRGTRETGVDTAFEANLIQGGSDIKIQEKRDTVVEFVKTVIRKLNQILKVYADTPTVTEIAGPEGSEWITWTNADIKGEFIEEVDIYNALPYSRDIEKKQAMEIASVANGNPYVNQTRLWEKVFRAFDWGDELLNTPEEMRQAMAMQQQQRAAEEAKRQQAQVMRPSGGEVRRASDMKAEMLGGAKKGRVA